ncbi:MAG TPA: hypothetical protein VFC78_00610 [Tepidisphaeraceae bacterium]|nr:hypothetical protein [Tepidisphaeraceae bacterium]
MKSRIRCALASLALIAGSASMAGAAARPVSIDMTYLRTIQRYSINPAVPDHVYMLVNGEANGKPLDERIPEGSKTWNGGPKTPPITDAKPVTLWKGELNDGQFALITVSVFQGDEKNPALDKAFLGKIAQAQKKTPGYSAPTLTAAAADKMLGGFIEKKGDSGEMEKQFIPGELTKNEQAVIIHIKDMFSRQKNTDHYGGLFNVLAWNDGKTIQKRVVPVGLTFGAHFGTDVKIYTKLKFTRKDNVFVKEDGQWTIETLSPLSDDEKTIRVKMLETELTALDQKKTTDYLADLQVKVGGQAQKWKLEAEVTGVDDIHTYWEYAD